MNQLFVELNLLIVDYLPTEDRIGWGCCCKKWYELFRNHVRILTVDMAKWTTEKKLRELINMIPRVIKRPSLQLDVRIHSGNERTIFYQLFEAVNYSMRELKCPLALVRDQFALQPEIFLHVARFHNSGILRFPDPVLEQDYSSLFPRIKDLELLALDTTSSPRSEIPVILSLKEFFILSSSCLNLCQVLPSLPRLYKLFLYECKISDVSMLGDIPDLTLTLCDYITDISSLNNNQKVYIQSCRGIIDYSHSFENSELIRLIISNSATVRRPIHQMNHWKRVKDLTITSFCRSHDFPIEAMIPITASRYRVHSGIRSKEHLVITPDHCLQEIQVGSFSEITSLTNLGWERLVLIGLFDLRRLSSLQGIGSGRNRKVIISNCPLITDYSPLRYVHEVKIETDGKVKLDELDHVHTLSIKARELITSPEQSYEQINEFNASRVTLRYPIDGLVKIPSLTISSIHFSAFKSYITEGGRVQNNKVSIVLSTKEVAIADIRNFYDEYMSPDYHLYWKGKEMVMLRK